MSKLSQRRKKMGYVSQTPRCFNCANYKEPYIYLKTNSETAKSNPLCKRADFTVSPNGCCDEYEKNLGS